jgi:23S rRNA U2552 (ribose-2'-O)-methylase RlmE/FtsJ
MDTSELHNGFRLENIGIDVTPYLGYYIDISEFDESQKEGAGEKQSPHTKYFLSESLASYLCLLKSRISVYGNQWEIMKKYTNTFEFLHTCLPGGTNKAVCSYRPISRSFFKMIELLKKFHLIDILEKGAREPSEGITTPTKEGLKSELGRESKVAGIQTFHLAEGPGGFVEALAKTRNNRNDVYYGMTLSPSRSGGSGSIPHWRVDRLTYISSFIIERGADGTGNLLSLPNLLHCRDKYANSMDLVTADGGFDFSLDFDSQEKDMVKLIFAETCFALLLQRHMGTFILKIFDCFTHATVDILFILSSFYEKVCICKPQTSRSANSEKYVVCTGFLPRNTDNSYQEALIKTFESMLRDSSQHGDRARFLSLEIPYAFYKSVEESNALFGQHQLENILNTMNLIELNQRWDKVQYLQKTNIQHCIDWCITHTLPFHSRSSLINTSRYHNEHHY